MDDGKRIILYATTHAGGKATVRKMTKESAALVRANLPSVNWTDVKQVSAFEFGYSLAWAQLNGSRPTMKANLKKILERD